MKHELLIRADGSSYLGLGHLVRSSSLAGYLKDHYKISFVCREIPRELEKEFLESGFGVIRIDSEEQFFDNLQHGSFAILDGYKFFDIEYQKKVKNSGALLGCITDDAGGDFIADLIINHAPGISVKQYSVRESTRFALGLDYALLRDPFIKLAQKGRTEPGFSNLFICFGGSDYRNLTNQTVKAVLDFDPFKNIFIITGSAFEHEIEFDTGKDERLHLARSLSGSEMAGLMARSDVAIVPASSILFEAIAAGCRVISGTYNENQQQNYDGFQELDAFADAGQFGKKELLNALKKSENQTPKKMIDGYSPRRYRKLFFEILQEYATTR